MEQPRSRGAALVRRGRDKGRERGEAKGGLGGWKNAVFSICRKQRAVDKICIIPRRISERNSLLCRCRRSASICIRLRDCASVTDDSRTY